jgi:FAD/FMN-containing dehydrogenase
MLSKLSTGMTQLKTTFPEYTHVNKEPQYDSTSNEFWTPAVILKPSCIFIPESADQVARALKIIGENQISFAVRGGGRNTNVGWSNVDGGVLISTSELRGLEFDEHDGKKVLKVGVGTTQLQIFEFLKDTGLAISTSERSSITHVGK